MVSWGWWEEDSPSIEPSSKGSDEMLAIVLASATKRDEQVSELADDAEENRLVIYPDDFCVISRGPDPSSGRPPQ